MNFLNAVPLSSGRRDRLARKIAPFLCKSLPLLFTALLLFYSGTVLKAENAVKGTITLSQSMLEKSRIIKLDGNWEFYWDRTYSPDDFAAGSVTKPDGYFPVPMYWTAYEKRSLPSEGKATYRLVIDNDFEGLPLSISIPEIYTEYRLYINNRVIESNGSFNNTRARFLKPQTFTFYSDTGRIEIVLNIENHNHNNAGIGQGLFLGLPEAIEKQDLFGRLTEIILVAVCFFAGSYHLILFGFRKKESELLYFGLFSLAIAFRTLSTGTTVIMQLVPDLPFAVGSRAATVIIPVCTMTFQLYVYSFFKQSGLRKVHRLLLAIHTLYGLLVFVTPTMIYTTLFTEYLFVILTAVLFIVVTSLFAIKKKVDYAKIFTLGFLVLALGIINDTLHYMQIINTGYYLALFFAFFIIAQSIVLAIKFSREHLLVEKLSNRLQLLDKLKDEFLANTSHELKTPLNGIIGISDSLIEGTAGVLPEKVQYNLNLISSSGRRLSSLINDILDYSKLKNKDIVLSEKNIDLRQMVSVVLTVIRSTTQSKEIQLLNSVPEDLPAVRGDENRLKQILFNLVGNAVKFTDEGSVRVFAAPENDLIKIQVEDTGTGISKENIEKIFISFEQADGTISREYGGTGLGLPITRQLVELQGGTIGVQSEPGTGSIFWFTMKTGSGPDTIEEHTEAIRPEEEHSPDAMGPFSAPKKSPHDEIKKELDETVLIVDDEMVNIQVLQNYLVLEGYKTRSATNGRDAIDLIEKENFDLILLDIMMPRMSGFEVCTLLRKKYTLYELPILMLTARNISHDIATAFQSGANDYLVKPIDRHELSARIRTHLSLRYAVDDALRNAHLANTDELTGMYNRRFVLQAGEREFRNCVSNSKAISTIMLDIDKFKNINDTYGHQAGDEVIKKIAETVTKNIRSVDIAARIGGEEFLIILPATGLDGARTAAEKIRKSIQKSHVATAEKGSITFTSSFGVATFDERTTSFHELIDRSDKMLYISKESGRNRVTAGEEF